MAEKTISTIDRVNTVHQCFACSLSLEEISNKIQPSIIKLNDLFKDITFWE
jgi:hypothetical protein